MVPVDPCLNIDSYNSLNHLYRDISDHDGIPHVIFCSLQKANAISADAGIPGESHLAHGLFYPKRFLDFTVYTSELPEKYFLNSDYIVLPWCKLEQNIDRLTNIFGNNLFIRPNSSQKSFTGFSKNGKKELVEEIRALKQIYNIRKEELCVITSSKEMDDVEYRFWIVDGKVSTWAPYSWKSYSLSKIPITTLETVKGYATQFAEMIGVYQEAIVADICIYNDLPKIIELNAVSTSGWYEGMLKEKLIEDLKNLGGF